MLAFFLFLAALFAPAERIEDLSGVRQETKEWLQDSLDAHVKWLEFKAWTVYGCIEKEEQCYFIKLHPKGNGQREFDHAHALQQYLPVIAGEKVVALPPFECLFQPYIASIRQPGGMLYDLFYLFPEQIEPIFSQMFSLMKNMVFNSIEIKIAPALNDRLFFERIKTQAKDGISGRIENFYSGKKLLGLYWEELLEKKFIVDGVRYDISIGELLNNARRSLDPSQIRPLALCHGDWHDMNICLLNGAPYFLDCDLAGENDPIGDACVFLIYNGVQGDYLGPKYHKNHFSGRECALQRINLQRETLNWEVQGDTLVIQDFHRFGTSEGRKDASRYFIDVYFDSLVEKILSKDYDALELEEKIRACLLMRFLAVYNLVQLDSADQARILAMLVTTLCQKEDSALEAFFRNL